MSTLAELERKEIERKRTRRIVLRAFLTLVACVITVILRSELLLATLTAISAILVGFAGAREVVRSTTRSIFLVVLLAGTVRGLVIEYGTSQEEQLRSFADGLIDGLRRALSDGDCSRDALPYYLQEPGEVFVGLGEDYLAISIESSRGSGQAISLNVASGYTNIERALGLPPCPVGRVGPTVHYSKDATITRVLSSVGFDSRNASSEERAGTPPWPLLAWPEGVPLGGRWLGFSPSADSLTLKDCTYMSGWRGVTEIGHLEFVHLLSRGRIPELGYDSGFEMGIKLVERECQSNSN